MWSYFYFIWLASYAGGKLGEQIKTNGKALNKSKPQWDQA